jgi:hypothetical protein
MTELAVLPSVAVTKTGLPGGTPVNPAKGTVPSA